MIRFRSTEPGVISLDSGGLNAKLIYYETNKVVFIHFGMFSFAICDIQCAGDYKGKGIQLSFIIMVSPMVLNPGEGLIHPR